MKTRLMLASAMIAGSVFADLPSVSDVRLVQGADSADITISYTLKNGPAVITLSIETNGPSGWQPLNGRHLWKTTGDVWGEVSGDREHTIVWQPDLVLGNLKNPSGTVRAVVSAWALDDTPDYLVLDLGVSSVRRRTYYPDEDYLPGGILSNKMYRSSVLVMRRIHAKGVTWTMGSGENEIGRANNEVPHEVTLDHDYYIGVFPVTQAQAGRFYYSPSLQPRFLKDGMMRPMEFDCNYYMMRASGPGNGGATTSYAYPDAPLSTSWVGYFAGRTGITDLDLPSEAEWEYACRAGHGDNQWGDGSPYLMTSDDKTTDANLPGRYRYNQADTTLKDAPAANVGKVMGPTNYTAIVGSYGKNSWGVYDMHGNIGEWCLDWYQADISHLTKGEVNANGQKYADGTNVTDLKRVIRGGSWGEAANACRSAARSYATQDTRTTCKVGFRLACRAGLN